MQTAELDRFIPNKSYQSFQYYSANLNNSSYDSYIKANMFSASRILTYHNKENCDLNNSFNCGETGKVKKTKKHNEQAGSPISPEKKILHKQLHHGTEPEKILDVPSIRDDFYLNTLDWSPLGPLGIGLDNEAYLYTPSNIVQLCKVLDGSYISSIKFNQMTVTVGFSDGKIRIFDIQSNSLIREIHEHQKRVSALAYNQNVLYSGSKDKNILVNDIRIKDSTVNKLNSQRGEICSLQCQPDLGGFMASGSNDNTVAIWDLRKHQLYRKYSQHKGAVKAISWCPWKTGVIATAGGAGDKTIRLWNINDKDDLSLKRTDTQISSLGWNSESGTLMSSHGHPNNQIIFWKPQLIRNKAICMQKVKILKGHSGRILNLAVSPSESMICSLSSDQTLCFWRIIDSLQDPWQPKKLSGHCRWSLKLK